MEEYKQKYNNLLKRYNNGIEYLSSHPDMQNKWLIELENIVNELDKMIDKYNIVGKNILYGFEE